MDALPSCETILRRVQEGLFEVVSEHPDNLSRHPEIAAALIQAFALGHLADQVGEGLGGIESALGNLGQDIQNACGYDQREAIESIGVNVSYAVDKLAEATQNIAAMLDLHSCGGKSR